MENGNEKWAMGNGNSDMGNQEWEIGNENGEMGNIVCANMIHSAIELVHLHTNSLLFTIMQKLIRSTIELVHNLQRMKMKRSDGKKQSRT